MNNEANPLTRLYQNHGSTVKFHYYSADGIPQLPVALRFHETV